MVILCDLCDSLTDKQSKIGFKINKDKSYIKYNDNDYLKYNRSLFVCKDKSFFFCKMLLFLLLLQNNAI